MKYSRTQAVEKIFSMKKRLRIIQGGTSAGKTIAILLILIDKAQSNFNKTISVVSETYPHLRRGAIKDFLEIMENQGYYKESRWNKTESTYTFETGSRIEFFSADQPGKTRGPRRNILFMNEANNIPYETYTQLSIRTDEEIYIDYNPVSEFWVHTDIIPNQEHDFIILTYKDNDALPKSIVEEIESRKKNKNFWLVYGLGQLGSMEGKIYDGWEIIDEIPKEARLVRKGLDFGYTNDPTALYDIYRYNDGFIVDEILYQKGLLNSEIANKIGKGQPLTVGDSAEPKSIAEIAMHGVNIIPSKKGKGSINHGIDAVRSRKISITKRSVNGIKEYRNYCYLKDVNGKITNDPTDVMNHACDAIRYAIADLIPDAEPEDAYIPETPYETPGIGSSKLTKHPDPIKTIVGPSKNRLAFLQERKASASEDYQTDTPYETPGLSK